MAHSHAQSGVNNHLHAHGKIKVNAKTDFDPTRTKTLRQSFTSALNKRWRTLRGKTRRQLRAIIANHSAQSDRDINAIINSFRNWFTRTIRKVVLEPASPSAVRQGKHWTAKYVREAYRSGIRRAYEAASKRGYDVPASPGAAGPAGNIQNPRHQAKLRQAYVKTYNDLQEIVKAVVEAVIEALREALIENKPVKAILSRVNGRIDAIGQTRSEVLAHTRTVDTVNTAALIVYALIGVKLIGVLPETPLPDTPIGDDEGGGPGVYDDTPFERGEPPASDEPEQPPGEARETDVREGEWVTADDNRVCPTCLMLEGRTWPLVDIIRGNAPRPPIHPRCRCYIIPVPLS